MLLLDGAGEETSLEGAREEHCCYSREQETQFDTDEFESEENLAKTSCPECDNKNLDQDPDTDNTDDLCSLM